MTREEMTEEEAITLLRANVMVACDTSGKVGYDTPLNKAIEQALDMVIKRLEQETVPREHYEHEFFLRKELDFKVARLEKQIAEEKSSEDCVSRECGRQKTGKWIDTKEISTNRRGQIVHEVICSECNGISYFRSMGNKYIGANLCPNCGSRNGE